MSNLSCFLAGNALKQDTIKKVVSKRFIGEDGKPVEWEIGCVSSEEDEMIRRACTKTIQVTGKKGQFRQETDSNMYLSKLTSKCVKYPDLTDVELQNSYGVMGEEKLLNTMLLPGEYADLIQVVQEANGYSETMEELVDEAKN